ncbi:Glycogen debranching enzyme [Armadillidium nasatum]|uniref:Glycogen debranching enzyme n=1 Tax=Armadillidium nasatum TaxID=96803 RepID=A0A5N5TIW5_9CRUS|nr:Glycogen debranching enzyme [Armadillidium nasatum]
MQVSLKLVSFPQKQSDQNGDASPVEVTSHKPEEASQAVIKEDQCTSPIESSVISGSTPEASIKKMQPQKTVTVVQLGYVLQFRPGTSLFGKKVNVFTNHPDKVSDTFERARFRRLPWKNDSDTKGDDTCLFVEVPIITAGSFRFYFTYDDRDDLSSAAGSGYFIVDPVLTYGSDNEILPLDCVQCQTVMAKCLGPFEEWPDRLRVSKESGYNMIHFTPIQELGASRSGYSLSDQHRLNPDFSTHSPKAI